MNQFASRVKNLGESDARINLVADIGGTNTRVAVARGGVVVAETVRRYRNRDFNGPDEILVEFSDSCGAGPFDSFCAAVAGPVLDGRATMTNIEWTIEAATIRETMNIPRVLLINDLMALGHSLDSLRGSETPKILESAKPKSGGTRLVVNIGTGFNSATVLATSAGKIVTPSECGHASLPVHSSVEIELHKFLSGRLSFVCTEDVLSGRGIETVYSWMSERSGGISELKATEISSQFGNGGLADRVGQIVTETLGTAVGDLALIHLPYGGIYLSGSVAKSFGPSFERFGFAEAFMNKGRYTALMSEFSIRLIGNDFAALLGCASYCADCTGD